MTTRKVKPNLSTSSIQITQVHGSMKAKDILSSVALMKRKNKRFKHNCRKCKHKCRKKRRSKENLY